MYCKKEKNLVFQPQRGKGKERRNRHNFSALFKPVFQLIFKRKAFRLFTVMDPGLKKAGSMRGSKSESLQLHGA